MKKLPPSVEGSSTHNIICYIVRICGLSFHRQAPEEKKKKHHTGRLSWRGGVEPLGENSASPAGLDESGSLFDPFASNHLKRTLNQRVSATHLKACLISCGNVVEMWLLPGLD